MEPPLQPHLKVDNEFPLCVELNVPPGRSVDEGMDAIHAFLSTDDMHSTMWQAVKQGFVFPKASANHQHDGSTHMCFVLVKPPPMEFPRDPQADESAYRDFLGMVNQIELAVFFARGKELHKRKGTLFSLDAEEQACAVARMLKARYAGKVDVDISRREGGDYNMAAMYYPCDWYGIQSGESKM